MTAGRHARRHARRHGRRRGRDRRRPRIGLFGLLGSGNLGNDASMESVLGYLRSAYPDAVVDAMCMGPERIRAQYGIAAVPHLWFHQFEQTASGPVATALKALGKGIDVFRTAAWVRRHDLVIVPGMGVQEASLPLKPFGVPYAMFLLCACGRLLGTRVALVSVGATAIRQRLTRWFFDRAARLASYRSYRDEKSRDAMTQRGLDTSRDHVYPDLVFGLPVPEAGPGDPRIVGVGMMAFYGGNDDRDRAGEIHARYTENMKTFVRWLVDCGYTVRIFSGDAVDRPAVQEILADIRRRRPVSGAAQVTAPAVTSLTDLMRQMAPAGTVVATRYHNVMSALRLGRPAISVGYAAKHDALMAEMGLGEFSLSALSFDVGDLIESFTALNRRSAELGPLIAKANALKAERLDDQFRALWARLLPEFEPPLALSLTPPPPITDLAQENASA